MRRLGVPVVPRRLYQHHKILTRHICPHCESELEDTNRNFDPSSPRMQETRRPAPFLAGIHLAWATRGYRGLKIHYFLDGDERLEVHLVIYSVE